jgi:hypothetical protein
MSWIERARSPERARRIEVEVEAAVRGGEEF